MAASGEGVTLYTLGHSRHAVETFIALARRHAVDLIVDVRGQPYSRFNPQYNRERFKESLANSDIDYVWFGDRLSGRPKDPKYRGPDNKVLWHTLMESSGVQDGIAEVLALAAETRLALVCAEENPLSCHRRLLLTPPLSELGAEVLHVRGDGRIEPEDELRESEGLATGGDQLNLFD
jgi:uncharacterized protein (DUF488 family)